jgi:hypothetical protein
MADRYEISDAERGFESGPKRQQVSSPDARAVAFEKEKHWLSQATKRIEEIEAGNARDGWKLTQAIIDDIYFSFEGADAPKDDLSDISVGAILTWELIEKDMDQGINYSWSRNDYVLGDLIYPNTPIERRTPVKTLKTIRWRNKEIAKEVKRELTKQAEQQLRGEDEEKSQEKIERLRDELHENNDVLIERAETPEDFEEAMSNIATDQALGGDDEGEQFREVGRRFEKKRDWVGEAAEDRPDSAVNKLRHIRNVATEQSLGADDEPEELEAGGLSEADKAIIRDKARQYAQDNAPPRFRLVSVDIEITDLGEGKYLVHKAALIDVEVTAHYEGGINERGLPDKQTESWKFNPNKLMRYPWPKRSPVKKAPYKY